LIQRLAVLFLTLSIQTVVWSQESKIRLISKINKDSIYVNECFSLSVRLLVSFENDVKLEFNDQLEVEIQEIKQSLKNRNLVNRDWQIVDIEPRTEYYNIKPYHAYELLRIGLCPYEPGNFVVPSFSVSLIKLDSAEIVVDTVMFSSEPKVIVVNRIPETVTDLIYTNEFYKMVGEFNLSDTIESDKKVYVGDTIVFKATIGGNGIGRMIDCNIDSTSGIQILSIDASTEKDLKHRSTKSRRNFHVKAVLLDSGTFHFGNFINWNYYSPKDDRIKSLRPKSVVVVHNVGKSENLQKYDSSLNLTNLIIALDVSQSMFLKDYQPTRLEEVSTVLHNFFRQNDYAIPIILFSDETRRISSGELSSIEFIEKFDGTAIGNALWESIKHLRQSKSSKKTILLIGDGDNTGGFMNIVTASQIAKQYEIKVISVGIGKKGKVPYGENLLGDMMYIEDTYNDSTLKKISELTESDFYRYTDRESFMNKLEQIFQSHSLNER